MALHRLSLFVESLTSWTLTVKVFLWCLLQYQGIFRCCLHIIQYSTTGAHPSVLNGYSYTTFCTHDNFMSLMLILNNKPQPADLFFLFLRASLETNMYSRRNGTVSLSIFHRTLIKEHKPQCTEKTHAHVGIGHVSVTRSFGKSCFLMNSLAKFG